MSRLGLKYFSPGFPGLPAVNGGTWNIATNYNVDFSKILQEVGIDDNDNLSVALFLRFTSDGLFICAAKRRGILSEHRRAFESIWIFVPSSMEISSEELISCVKELPLVYDHPEAFESPEAFLDIVPEIFNRDFPDREILEEKTQEPDSNLSDALSQFISEGKTKDNSIIDLKEMRGTRVGYLSLENDEELTLVLSGGFKKQYRNFGLILLTDNPVRVESSLPGIFLPELMILRQKRIEEENHDEEKSEDLMNPDNEETKAGEEREEENEKDSSEDILENNENSIVPLEEDILTPEISAVSDESQDVNEKEDNIPADSPKESETSDEDDYKESNVGKDGYDGKTGFTVLGINKIDLFSFFIGFSLAVVILILIYLLIK